MNIVRARYSEKLDWVILLSRVQPLLLIVQAAN